MPPVILASIAAFMTAILLCTLDFAPIPHYNEKQKRPGGSSRVRNFTFLIFVEEDLLSKDLHNCAEYAHETPRFLPRLSRDR